MTVSRRHWIIHCFAALLGMIWVGHAESAVAGPGASIVIPPQAMKQRRDAAAVLQKYVARSSGTRLALVNQPGPGPSIHVGRSPYVDALNLRLEELGPDGFVLNKVDDRNYVITGLTEDGTEFGVYEFLERYVGVRWLLPGEFGVDVPTTAHLEAGDAEIRSVPAFFSRNMSGVRGPDALEWARRNRMRSGIEFHHNLYRLFPPSKYAKTHPEFYPLFEGKRYVPADDGDPYWQPNFSAPGLVEEAARTIIAHFRKHPEDETFSLGVNDGRRYDESPESLARENSAPNYLGRRNVSDSYFRWCNEVVELVLKEFPDKYFGCLAYSQTADPPRFKLNPHIVPFLTYERLRWSDPKLRALIQNVTQRWQAAATTLGWYDYAYGQDYCLPRVWPHVMREYLQFARAHSVRAHYAELYPSWGEGPKAYVFLRLQWNPDQDVDAILNDWYERCVGPAAAPLVKEYYEIWERFWTATVHRSSAYWAEEGQYLGDDVPEYMEVVDPTEIAKSRSLLTQCVQRAGTDLQRKRAEFLNQSFDFYESSALAYRANVLAATAPIHNAQQAAERSAELEQAIKWYKTRRELVLQRKNDPLLSIGTSALDRPILKGETWHAGLLWRLLNWVQPGSAARAGIERIRDSNPVPIRDNAAALLAIADGRCQQIIANSSFESAMEPWRERLDAPGGSVRRVEGTARTGQWSIVSEGVESGGPCLLLEHVPPGSYVAVPHVYRPVGTGAKGVASLCVQLRGEQHAFWAPSLRFSPPAGEWVPMAYPFDVPSSKDGHPITAIYVMMLADHLAPRDKFYFDDLCIYRLPDTLHPRSLPMN